jgi:hypothetical protein
MKELTPEEARYRAERARQLLKDELFKESFDLAHEALIGAVKLAKTENEAYKAAIALQVFELIKNSIVSHGIQLQGTKEIRDFLDTA